jgi:hypothetical protein
MAECYNLSGRDVNIYTTTYNSDSVKVIEVTILPACPKEKPCGAAVPINTMSHYIRIDLIATDKLTNDTLLSKSFNYAQIHSGSLDMNITSGDINKLPPDFKTSPRLLFDTDKQQKRFKLNDTIYFKLTNENKVNGSIKYYDKTKIIIETFDKKQISINRKDIEGVKLCSALLAIGPRVGVIDCNYTDISKSKYKIVHQVLLHRPDGAPTKYVWKE